MTNKLTLFGFENGLELSGEMYVILLKQQEEKLLADVFIPLKLN